MVLSLRRRLATVAALTAVLAGSLVVTTPQAASADVLGPPIPCPTDPSIVWTAKFLGRGVTILEGVAYTVRSSTPVFYVSDARVVDNATDSDISATFTSTRSRTTTVSLTVTLGTTFELTQKLQTTVSVNIVQSRTTSIGVNATLTVPAHRRAVGEYGIEAYVVEYDARLVWQRYRTTNCGEKKFRSGVTDAPTMLEGWRFTST